MPLYYLTACTGLQARLFYRKQGSMYRKFSLFTLNEGTEGKLFISLSPCAPVQAPLISSGATSSYYVLTGCNSKHFTFKKGLPNKVLY